MHERTIGAMASVILATAPVAGCTTHQCDASTTTLGPDSGGTWNLSCDVGCSLTWRSGPFIGPWLPFPGNKTYTFEFPPLPPLPAGAVVNASNISPNAYVALTPPTASGAPENYAQTTGADLEYVGYSYVGSTPTSLSVTNPSCADYSLYVTLTVEIDLEEAVEGGLGSGAEQ
ncbi:MAG TPA: hypothetical protein VEK07_04055 [Polyangiaceae bacterium]|nr:hypothetical protein [Polyangiaceae bacterium]